MACARIEAGRRLLGLLVLLAALLSAAGTAFAHAALVGTSPADGAVLAAAPTSFRLTFNEPVAVTSLKLSGGGRTVAIDRFKVDGAAVEIEAPAGLADGPYALSFRVVSEDGHPIAGAVSFSFGVAQPGAPAPETDPTDPMLEAAIWTARVALYLGLLFGAGGAFALAWLGEIGGSGRRVAIVASLIGFAAAPVAFALQGADLVGAPVAGAFDALALRQALATTYATTVALALATLALALVSFACRRRWARALSALALAGVGLSFAASGHASAASPQALTRACVFLHGVAAAFWIGALPHLGLALGRGSPDGMRSLERFSAAAPYAVGLLLIAGAILAVRQAETVTALWTTDYGLVLTTKLALVAALLGLAVANRWRWTQPTLDGDAAARRSLRRSIAAELAIGAVILGVVALWRFTPPPRALAMETAAPALAHLQSGAAQADLTVSPGRVGQSDVTVMIMTGDFGPLDAKALTIVLSNPAAGVEPIRRDARKPGDGTWRVDGVPFPVAGQWTVRLDILVTDFDLERLDGRIEIRP